MKIQTPISLTLFPILVSLVHSTTIYHTAIVDQSNKACYASIQKAIDSVPSGNSQWYKIHISPGIYKEKVTITRDKGFIFLEGAGASRTTITWDDHQRTDSSATFTVFADNFVAKGITFKNSYNVPFSVGGTIRPALAARVYGDKVSFHGCGFVGFQDTLWAVQGRHYYNSCYIEGAVDFIWGRGQAVFENCDINVTAGLLPMRIGYITAQGRRSRLDSNGFVFIRGRIYGSGETYLGRAYGPFSRVLFHGTNMGKVVNPLGWDAWHYKGHEKNFMYAEAGCLGKGANPSERVSWAETQLGILNLLKYSKRNFIDQDRWLAQQP